MNLDERLCKNLDNYEKIYPICVEFEEELLLLEPYDLDGFTEEITDIKTNWISFVDLMIMPEEDKKKAYYEIFDIILFYTLNELR